LLINDTVYAELAVRYDRIEELEAFLDEAGLEMTAMPGAALFLAGKIFAQYRRPQRFVSFRCSPAILAATAHIFRQ
jgi:hypothetical protein